MFFSLNLLIELQINFYVIYGDFLQHVIRESKINAVYSLHIIGFPTRFHIFVSEFNFEAFKFRQLRQTIISVSQILNRVIEILFETSGLIL